LLLDALFWHQESGVRYFSLRHSERSWGIRFLFVCILK